MKITTPNGQRLANVLTVAIGVPATLGFLWLVIAFWPVAVVALLVLILLAILR